MCRRFQARSRFGGQELGVGFLKVVPTHCTSAHFPTGPLTILNKGAIVRQMCRRITKVLSSTCITASSRHVRTTMGTFKKGIMVASARRGDNASHYRRTYAGVKKRFSIIIGVRKSRPFVRPSRLRTIGTYFSSPTARVTALIGPFAMSGNFRTLRGIGSPGIILGGGEGTLCFDHSVVPCRHGTTGRS